MYGSICLENDSHTRKVAWKQETTQQGKLKKEAFSFVYLNQLRSFWKNLVKSILITLLAKAF